MLLSRDQVEGPRITFMMNAGVNRQRSCLDKAGTAPGMPWCSISSRNHSSKNQANPSGKHGELGTKKKKQGDTTPSLLEAIPASRRQARESTEHHPDPRAPCRRRVEKLSQNKLTLGIHYRRKEVKLLRTQRPSRQTAIAGSPWRRLAISARAIGIRPDTGLIRPMTGSASESHPAGAAEVGGGRIGVGDQERGMRRRTGAVTAMGRLPVRSLVPDSSSSLLWKPRSMLSRRLEGEIPATHYFGPRRTALAVPRASPRIISNELIISSTG